MPRQKICPSASALGGELAAEMALCCLVFLENAKIRRSQAQDQVDDHSYKTTPLPSRGSLHVTETGSLLVIIGNDLASAMTSPRIHRGIVVHVRISIGILIPAF